MPAVLRRLPLLLALLAAAPLTAQTVRGTVVDEAQRPVAGALVVLVAADSSASGGALTDEQGRFTLGARPGRYTVRAERTGYRSAESVVELAAGQTVEVQLASAVQPFVLPPVEVVAESRCTVRPGQGLAAYTLWDEARKALRATAVLQDAQLVRYTVRTYRSELVIRTGRSRRQEDAPRRVTGRPFQTLAPAELASGGYVRFEGDSVLFYGPDAQVLLSDAFLDTHCLYVNPAEAERATVALAFEPVRREGIVDIQGVLRLDRRTGELREVEYAYTELASAPGQSSAGGAVEFQRLRNGAWVVSRWRIRTTNVARVTDWEQQRHAARQVTDIREAGGEVADIELVQDARGASAP